MDESNIVVLGVGNILLKDEGVGVHAVTALQKKYIFRPAIQIIDGGTMGIDLLPYFEQADKMVIVDAANLNAKPGTIVILENDDVLVSLSTKISSHHGGLNDILSQAKLLDTLPRALCFIGVQPDVIVVGLQLSEKLAHTIDAIVEIILGKLEEWQVESHRWDALL